MNSWRIIAVLSLAVGLALTIALSSIADGILFRPLPVARASEIVRIYSASPLRPRGFVSFPDYQDFARQARTVSGLIAQTQVLLAVGGRGDEPAEVRMGLAVTANYFDVLGADVRIGRSFRQGEERDAVVVLSHACWQRTFGGDRGIVGRRIELARSPFTVLGIASPGFGLDPFLHEDFYIPLEVYATGLLPANGRPLEERGRRYLSVYARRVAPLPAVQGEIESIATRLAAEYPAADRQQKAVVMTELAGRRDAEGSLQSVAWVLLAVAALSLAAACVNLSGLVALEYEARAGVLALKAALGAGPLRLFREALIECLALMAAGIAAAIPLAWAALRAAARLWTLETSPPVALDTRLDAHAAFLAIGAACVLALAAAWPCLRPYRGLASARHTASRSAMRSTVVILQVSLATMLVATGASLLGRMISARCIDLGYRTDHVLLATFDPSQTRSDEIHTRAFYHDLLDRAGRVPGVRAAAIAQSVPLGFTSSQKMVKLADAGPDPLAIGMNTVTPGYFELMQIPLLAGRAFTDRDSDRTPRVAVVNDALAKSWPGGAVGRTMEVEGRPVEVVGVVRTAKYNQITEAPRPFFYLPYAQNYAPRMTLHILTQGRPADAAQAIVATGRTIDPGQRASDVGPLDQVFSAGALYGVRIGITVTAAAGGCAWLLSLAGIFSCIASAVNRRRREIGIRVALGARRAHLMREVLVQGCARLAAAGLVAGLALASLPGPWISSMVPDRRSSPLAAEATAGALVAITCLLAGAIPAWRATGGVAAVSLRRN